MHCHFHYSNAYNQMVISNRTNKNHSRVNPYLLPIANEMKRLHDFLTLHECDIIRTSFFKTSFVLSSKRSTKRYGDALGCSARKIIKYSINAFNVWFTNTIKIFSESKISAQCDSNSWISAYKTHIWP